MLLVNGISFSQNNTSTNLDLIDRLIDESLNPLNDKLLALGKNNFYRLGAGANNPLENYLQSSIKRKLAGYKILSPETSDTLGFVIVFRNPFIETKYKRIYTDKILGTKKVEREVLVAYDIDLINKNNSTTIYNQHFNKRIKDSFDLDKLSLIEDRQYLFSYSELPEENNLNRILYPAILITASAAAIILFFII